MVSSSRAVVAGTVREPVRGHLLIGPPVPSALPV
jgi:hypothetical protein